MNTLVKPGIKEFSLMIFVALIWASAFIALKISVPEFGAYWSAFVRVFIGFLCILPFALIQGVKLPQSSAQAGLMLVISIFNIVLPFMLINQGIKHVDAGLAALLMGCTPFCAMILAHFFTKDEKINLYRILSVALGLSGVLTTVGVGVLYGAGASSTTAQILIFTASFCYAIAGICMRYLTMRALEFTVCALAIGSVVLLFVALIFEGAPDFNISGNAWLALIWLGAFPTGVGYILRFYMVQRVGMSVFSVTMNSIPVLGILMGVVVLGETLHASTLIALFLVVCGFLVARMASRPSAKESTS